MASSSPITKHIATGVNYKKWEIKLFIGLVIWLISKYEHVQFLNESYWTPLTLSLNCLPCKSRKDSNKPSTSRDHNSLNSVMKDTVQEDRVAFSKLIAQTGTKC